MEKLTLLFTQEEIQILSEGLVSLPYKTSAQLIFNLQSQIDTQLKAEKEKEKDLT